MSRGIYEPLLYKDPLKTFLPAFFPHIMEAVRPDGTVIKFPSPPFHHEIIDALKEMHPRTMILAPRGSSKCGDFSLITPSGDVHVRDITVGADVLSLEDSGKIGLRKVIAKEYSGQKECWKLTTRSGREIVCTEDHRLLTQSGYKKLKDITVKDFIMTARTLPVYEKEVNEDEIMFITYMLMEGGCSNGNCTFTNSDLPVVEKMRGICERLGFKFRYTTRYCYAMTAGTASPRDLLRKYGVWGKRAIDKRFPEIFFHLPEKLRWKVFGAIIETDGYIMTKNDSFGIVLASEGMIKDIQKFMLQLGIASSRKYKQAGYMDKEGNMVWKDSWVCWCSGKYAQYIYDNCDMAIKKDKLGKLLAKGIKRYSLVDIVPRPVVLDILGLPEEVWTYKGVGVSPHHQTLTVNKIKRLYDKSGKEELLKIFEQDVMYDAVSCIENVGFRDTWDVQIEGTENFVSSEGIVSHNSTLLTFLWLMYITCYGISPFTIVVSDSYKKACGFLERLKRELMGNKFLIETFQISKGTPWATGELVLHLGWLNGKRMRILARGAGQSLRGYVDDVRPTCVMLDDIEDEKNTNTPEQREKVRDWLYGQVLPGLDPVAGQLIIAGTIVHEDALLARLYNSPPSGWKVMRYGILDADGKPIWKDRFPLEKINAIKEEYARQGVLSRFYMEYMNNPSAKEFRSFSKEQIRYYNPFSIEGNLRHYMATDFGYSLKGDSDYSVIMVAGVDDGGNIYVREYVRDRLKPSEVLSYIMDMYEKYACNAVGIETNGPQKVYYYMLDEERNNRSAYNVKIIELNQNIKKDSRIIQLQPKFEGGQIFILPDMKELENEIVSYSPNSRSNQNDDLIDTLSNMLIVLNKCNAGGPRKKYNPVDYSNYTSDVPQHIMYMP